MTRINLIEPNDLTKRHLVAEYKEITQFLHLVRNRVDKGHPMDDIPSDYSLNGGHCLFFFDKGEYIYHRYQALKNGLDLRGVNVDEDKYVSNLSRITDSYSQRLWNDYNPTMRDYSIVIERIQQRIDEKPHLYPDADVFKSSIGKYIT